MTPPDSLPTERQESEEMVRFGHIAAWSKKLEIPKSTLWERTQQLSGIRGVTPEGRTRMAYAEQDVRRACFDLLVPQTDELGFIHISNIRFAAISTWANELKIKRATLERRLENVEGMAGKNLSGKPLTLYSEVEVLTAIKGLEKSLPEANEDGFFVKEDIHYGHKTAWTNTLKINSLTIKNRVESLPYEYGKSISGRREKFYAEHDVRTACADLLSPIANPEGEVRIGDTVGICIYPFARKHQLDGTRIIQAAVKEGLVPIAKSRNGKTQAVDVYRKQDIENLDYVRKNKDKSNLSYLEKWEETANQLVVWLNENSKWPNTEAEDLVEKNLAHWVSRQRKRKKEGKLDTNQIALLDGLNMIWEPFQLSWDNQFEAVSAFIKQYGKLPEAASSNEEESKLGKWIQNQRTRFKKNKLSEQQINKLEALGIVWDCLDSSWNQMYEVLKNHLNEEKSWPANWTEGSEQTLATWLHRQRQTKRGGKLDKDRIAKLEELGIVWEPFESQWFERFDKLKNHINEHQKWPTNNTDSSLASWVSLQRRRYEEGTLDKEKINQLELLGINWNPIESGLISKIDSLKKFRAEGKGWPSAKSPNDSEASLGKWLYQQRFRYKKGKLSNERIAQLENLGFTWEGQMGH